MVETILQSDKITIIAFTKQKHDREGMCRSCQKPKLYLSFHELGRETNEFGGHFSRFLSKITLKNVWRIQHSKKIPYVFPLIIWKHVWQWVYNCNISWVSSPARKAFPLQAEGMCAAVKPVSTETSYTGYPPPIIMIQCRMKKQINNNKPIGLQVAIWHWTKIGSFERKTKKNNLETRKDGWSFWTMPLPHSHSWYTWGRPSAPTTRATTLCTPRDFFLSQRLVTGVLHGCYDALNDNELLYLALRKTVKLAKWQEKISKMWINFGNLSAGKDPNLVRCKLSDPGTRTQTQFCSANFVELYQLLSSKHVVSWYLAKLIKLSIHTSLASGLPGFLCRKPRNGQKTEKPSRHSNKWWIDICSAHSGRHYPNWHPTWEQVASMAPQKREVMKWVGWKYLTI